MKNNTILFLSFVSLALLGVYSCNKKFDTPPLQTPNAGAQVFIAKMKPRVPANGRSLRLSGDSSLYCTITADESSGNIYKQVFVKDDAGDAIQLNLTESGGLYVGDRLRINLNGVYLVNANSMIYLDSVNYTKHIVKLSSGNVVSPRVISLQTALSQTNPANAASLQSQLVQISPVEFAPNATTGTFADAVTKSSVNQTLKECGGSKSIIVRSSGYANFAAKPLPAGSGTITAVLTQYNGDMQLTIRNYAEISMNQPSCSTPTVPAGSYLSKDFNDNSVTSGGWSEYKTSGNVGWKTSTAGGAPNPYCQISNFANSVNSPCETWLISPSINLSASTNPVLNFRNAYKFTGAPLELYVIANYTGGNPTTSAWTKLSFTLSSGNFVFANSGDVALSAYKSATTRFAFRYQGSSSDGSTWEVDDIVVKEK